MWQPNLKKHLERCKKKKEMNAQVHVTEKNDDHEKLKQEHQILQIKFEMIYKFVRGILVKGEDIIGSDIQIVPEEMIKKMNIAESTKKMYLSDWKAFHHWCTESKSNPFLVQSANNYITALKLKQSTLSTKKSALQSILQYLLGRKVVLRKVKEKNSYDKEKICAIC